MMSLAMLAFVILETVRCFVPSQTVKVVSGFAAAKLCHAYLKEVYLRLFHSQHSAYLERWCVEHCKAIHPPSQYYGQYFRTRDSSNGRDDSCMIPLKRGASDATVYKDFHLQRLAELDAYLSKNRAELYLTSPLYEGEEAVLGMLASDGVATNRQLRATIESMGNRTVNYRRVAFEEEDDEFWESQHSALAESIHRAVDRADPVQVRVYLDAINKPLTVLREARQHRVIRSAYGEYVRRGYDFLRLYLIALDEILASQERGPRHRAKHTFALARVLLKSVWEETRDILRDMDYHTMELFTWIVPQMYQTIQEVDEKAGPLRGMRAEFGGFYAFADGWLKDAGSKDVEAAGPMQLVLYDGLTKWLLMAVEKKDTDLIEQLCDAARMIVFGRKGVITFDRGELVVRHFVLAGCLMERAREDNITATAIERLFEERYSHDSSVKFDDLVTFYRDNRFPHQTAETYLRIFYKPERETTDLLTGSSHSSGFGMTGQHQMALAFIYLGACALVECIDEPQVIPEDMSFELNDDAMQTVAELFTRRGISHGIERLKAWRDKCGVSSNEGEAREIANGALNPSKVEAWTGEFWARYARSSPVLFLCLRNGNYEIAGTASTGPLRYDLPKIAVMDWKYPISGASGNDYGRGFARHMEGELLGKIIAKMRSVAEVDGTLSDLMRRAVAWLKKAGCEGQQGMIVAVTAHAPSSELFGDDDYVPSWREEVQSHGFDGFYDGFPVVWHKEHSKEDEGDTKPTKSHEERVVAVDLKGWKGLRTRESVITEQQFGELTIRTWTEEEIQNAIEAKKLEPKYINKAKGNCPVYVCLYWELSSSRPPHRRAFQIRVPDGEVASKADSEPAE
jgi:hypothetical protein